MATYRTPDVYVEEIPTLPPSVAEVSTAIPAFIGYTQKAIDADGKDVTNIPVRINTLLEYMNVFGGPDKTLFTVNAAVDNTVTSVTQTADKQHRLYYSLDHFFKNGGGSCYIVSIGGYVKDKSSADFTKGLAAIAREDEPTLLMISEAATLTAATDYYDVCQAALDQAALLKDRFAILDVLNSDTTGADFRNGITNNLKYGAAYFPYLQTTINYQYEEADVAVVQANTTVASTTKKFALTQGGIKVTYTGKAGDAPTLKIVAGTGDVTFVADGTKLTINNIGAAAGKNGSTVLTAWGTFAAANTSTNFTIEQVGDGSTKVTAIDETPLTLVPDTMGSSNSKTMADIKDTQTGLYNAIKTELNKYRVTLPPSPAVAGVYASVDRDRGVWKAPANVGLNAVIAPTVKISAQEQEKLNIDDNSGKSINAIRAFAGKGILVWGARTLAGNDNEWRYVPVRRLFNMVEESSRKASAFAVFEPNDATTWLKVKGMLESYLYGLWQQGALAGPKPESAYFVNVGLGKTMTTQDVLEGRMIIEIGIAAVRPAEFIILKFSHKLQEA